MATKLKPVRFHVDEDGSLMDIDKVYKMLVKVRNAKFTSSEIRKFKFFLHDYITNPYNE